MITKSTVISIIFSCLLLIFGYTIIDKSNVFAYTSGDYFYKVVGSEVAITDYVGEAENIKIPVTIGGYKVSIIDDGAFEHNYELTGVTIPDGVNIIGDNAFKNCSRLKSVQIPDSVTSIGCNAFYECISLTNINIPKRLSVINEYVFAYCYNLIDLNIPDGVTFIGEKSFLNCAKLENLDIPDSVIFIGENAFAYCYNLSSITIPSKVSIINAGTFSNCDKLTSIALPGSITKIGNSAFSNCDSLVNISLPDSVDIIGNSVFSDCDRLRSITMPNSVTSIGGNAFYDCENLNNVIISDNVTNIYDNTFYNCKNLKSIVIPDSVTSIGNYAFYNCIDLTNLTIGKSVTSIGTYAFYNCNNLNFVNLYSITAPTTFSNSFNVTSARLHVPTGAIGYNTEPWTLFNAPKLFVPADVTAAATGKKTIIKIGDPTAYDIDAPNEDIIIKNDAPKYGFVVGTTIVKWTATDSNGNSTSLTQNITVNQYKINSESALSLEKTDHIAYITGYPDYEIKPTNKITREETAVIFYRLLTDKSRYIFLSDSNLFTDVDSNRWSNRAISTLSNAGALNGYSENFKPDEPITRAEFTAIASMFDIIESGASEFTDIDNHWAEEYINSAKIKGWISGYSDKTFKPDQHISRAEVMIIINNILKRKVSKENIHENAIIWEDNPSTAWYYEAIEEATNSHNYITDNNGSEIWTEIIANKVWP